MSAVRTCVFCRGEEDRGDLIRLALDPSGALVVDYRARLPGRGAWVHPRRACVDLAAKQAGRLAKALHAPRVDASGLLAQLQGAVARSIEDGLSQAAAAGALICGHDALERALRSGAVVEVALANDAAERTERDLRRVAGEDVPFTVVSLDRDALGARVGRAPLAAVGVTDASASVHLRRQLRRLRELG